jgi:hypothetical protein
MKNPCLSLSVLIAGLFVAGASHATVVSTYELDLASGGVSCPVGGCGTVVLSSPTGALNSDLTFTVNLAAGVSFVDNGKVQTSPGNPVFWFDLTGPITFSGLPESGTIGSNGYTYNGPTSGSFAPSNGNFPGPYNYEISCLSDVAGNLCASTKTNPLTFVANGATGIGAPIDSQGLFSGKPVAFVADLSVTIDGVTNTGLVGSELILGGPGLTTAVPEPSTWAMMIVGFMGLGFLAYRKKNSIPRFA